MKISSLNNNYLKLRTNFKYQKYTDNNESYSNINLTNLGLIPAYGIFSINFKSKQKDSEQFELNYSYKELQKRLAPDVFTEFRMLDENSSAYQNLQEGDKEALKHLVKAANIFDSVYKRLDNIHNLPFEKYLDKEVKKGNERAALTKKLYDAQKGIIAKTVDAKPVELLKNMKELPGKGFYPEDLSEKEFHKILIDMLNNGEQQEVQNILNQRSVVLREGKKLKAIDYTDYFKEEFVHAADELMAAAMTSTNDDFNRYLVLQANALIMNNPYMDALADKQWATLQDTPLEFTIGRECYDDKMTPSVRKNKELSVLLDKYGITPYAKDSLGVRVGIVNKEGTDYILKIKDFLPFMASKMPFNNEYEQTISNKTYNKQTMVDADIVNMTGQYAAYRGAISIASNLPNNDKLSVQTGGGKRNVYHRQMRMAKYSNNKEQLLNALLEKSQHKYFDVDAMQDFTILHENVHSLGPKDGLEALGNSKNTIEEHKADAGALVMLDELTKAGFYSALKEKQVITSYLVGYVLKGPDFENAHRARNILQHNYFIQHGAIDVSKDGKMKIHYDKVIDCAHKMLENAVRLQLEKSPEKAEKYLKDNVIWSKELQKLADNLNSVDKKMNSYITTPLADSLVKQS